MVADRESDWLACYDYDLNTAVEPFIFKFHAFKVPVLDLLDENSRQAIIKSMVEHQARLVKTIRSMSDEK